MPLPILEVKNLSKRYRLGQFNAQTMREEFERFVQRFRRKSGSAVIRHPPTDESEFWALKDVSFSVALGEIVGIIGSNGAGKSTLLKILSRVTQPSTGEIRIRGRVASLLEVGSGFHPELTGRENIYLNAAILGMSKAEAESKFDEIVAFAEVDKFLDTPVKRYSSGMYVRLAFAVAAHLEPEVLIVDEVLAVGDHEFQKKCLGKMDSVARAGRTVLFVSHSMESVTRLCSRAILLEDGRIGRDGGANDVVRAYIGRSSGGTTAVYHRAIAPSGNQEAWIKTVKIVDSKGAPCGSFMAGEPIRFRISFELSHPCHIEIGLALTNDQGRDIAAPNSRQQYGILRGVSGTNHVECRMDGPPLTPKQYSVRVDLGDYYVMLDSVDNAVRFDVQPTDYFRTGRLPNPNLAVLSKCTWYMLDD